MNGKIVHFCTLKCGTLKQNTVCNNTTHNYNSSIKSIEIKLMIHLLCHCMQDYIKVPKNISNLPNVYINI